LSTRLFYHALSDLYKKIKKCDPPLSLHGQLLWREFFYCAATRNPNFDKMAGNPICVQVPWDNNREVLSKWANAQTGYPWIDAIMTQLREEGWIHHLARHATACFLTRGDLWVSWEEGMRVFDELLLDADWSVNAGTWMWLSCSSFFQQFFHCYCPVKFGRKADANGDFIRRYLPVLKNFPTRYIHEPWTAPETVQKSAKCIIGQDYPRPMCNHEHVSKLNMERMKQVFGQLAHFRRSGQTGAGVPHELLAQMKKFPKIPGETILSSGSSMGPPNTPVLDNRRTAGRSQLCSDSGGVQSSQYQHQQQQQQHYSNYSNDNLVLHSYSQPLYSTPDTFNSLITTSYSYPTNFTSSDTVVDSLPIISGDMMLPGPISSNTLGSATPTLVEGGSTISNMSIISEPGSVEHLESLSPQHLNSNSSLIGLNNYDAALAEGFFGSNEEGNQN